MHQLCPSRNRGRREHRMLAAPASLACKRTCALCARKQRQGSRNNRRSLRNGLTAYTWSPRCAGLFGHRRLAFVTRGLISASGDRDRTISPYAIRASSLRAPRPSLPAANVRDDRDTPLRSRRDARTIRMICVSDKENYFCIEGLTSFRKISPSGKSNP